jgi:hypothetical protein
MEVLLFQAPMTDASWRFLSVADNCIIPLTMVADVSKFASAESAK